MFPMWYIVYIVLVFIHLYTFAYILHLCIYYINCHCSV